MRSSFNDTKQLWSIVNRSKGIVEKTVEDLKDVKYSPESMSIYSSRI